MKKITIFMLSLLLCCGILVSQNLNNRAMAASQQNALQSVRPNLNSSWELAYFNMDSSQWIAEYGLKGEDVIHFKWTKLITVNCFYPSAFKLSPETYAGRFEKILSKQADSMSRKLYFQYFPVNKNEVWFEWSIPGRNEFEVCRVFRGQSGFYHMHYAQKTSQLSQSERNNIIAILKNIQVN